MNALQNLIGPGSNQLIACIVAMIVIFAVMFYRMMKASTELRYRAEAMLANPGASFSLTIKGSTGTSLEVRLDKDALQKARDLFHAGNDLESLCREIDPAYANWRSVQQQAFRRAIEMVLNAEPTAQNSPRITTQAH